jgi:1,4-dihydroxy-2-naphthoate octaprenyltransferase
MNLVMWGRAVRDIPRLTREEWGELDVVARWLIATRSAVLILTIVSSSIGGLLALRAGLVDTRGALLWGLSTLGLMLAHATNNLLNDLTDHLTGADRDNSFRAQYGPHPIEHGLMTKRQLLVYAALTGAVALAIGGFLAWQRGMPVVWLFAAGVFFVLFYTYPLKYFGLGEFAVLAVWGPLMVGGTYLVVTGTWSNDVALASLPYALSASTVIFGKHIDKLASDEAKRIRTLPVIIGERAARGVALLFLFLQYALVGLLIYRGIVSWVLSCVLLAVPRAVRFVQVYTRARPEAPPPELPKGVWPLWYVALGFSHARIFGMLLILGLIVDTVLHRMGIL